MYMGVFRGGRGSPPIEKFFFAPFKYSLSPFLQTMCTICVEKRDKYDIYARLDKLCVSHTLNITRSTPLQDRIQGGPKKLAHFVWYALT